MERTGPRPSRVGRASSRSTSIGPALMVVYGLWAIQLMDLHYFLGEIVAAPLGRILTFAFLLLFGLLVFDAPRVIPTMKSWMWYAPFALLLAASMLSLPKAQNLLVAQGAVQYFILYYALGLATAIYVRTPMQALPILALFCWRFLWWGIFARGAGLIPWHPTLANYDGFGGLMVQGVAISYWFALAVHVKWQRNALMAIAAYCVVGVVASHARGAFLALVAVTLLIWIRSPRKGLTTLAFLGGALVTVVATNLLFEDGFFWREIMSAFEEGTEAGTGQHRWQMWGAAVEVWKANPIFGVGAGNFGVYASEYFRPGQIEGFENPATFWGLNLHSAYFQILSEFGLVGVIAFIWIMVDFVRKNRALHDPAAQARWTASGAERVVKLRYLAYGIEAGLVGVTLANMVYASLFEPWFATLWIANRMLWATTRPTTPAVRARSGFFFLTRRSVRRSHLG